MKNLRKLLRVRWTEKKTNEWVLDKAGTHRQLLANVKARKMTYFGHILRKNDVCLEKDLIQGTLPGGRRRGKPRTSWIGNLTSWTTMNMDEMLRSTEDRTGWQQLVRSVTNPRIEDSWSQVKSSGSILKLRNFTGKYSCMLSQWCIPVLGALILTKFALLSQAVLSFMSYVNADIAIECERPKFDPSQNPNHLTDYDKTLHSSLLCLPDEHVGLTRSLYASAVRQRLGKYVTYNTEFLLFFPDSPTEVTRGWILTYFLVRCLYKYSYCR